MGLVTGSGIFCVAMDIVTVNKSTIHVMICTNVDDYKINTKVRKD